MKKLKTFENWFKSKKEPAQPQVIEGADDAEVNELFNKISSTFNEDNLERIDQAMYGYYFRYKIDNNISLEVGLGSVSVSRNNQKFERLNVSKDLRVKLIDYFETKGKGEIRPSNPVGY